MQPRARPVIVVLRSPDGPPPPDLSALADRAELRVTDADGLRDALVGARALFLWDFFSSAVEGAWPQAEELEWIHVAAAGVDKLLFDDLVRSEVVVTNARGIFDRPIAEFVLASILAFAKDLHGSHDLQQRREWRHRETRTVQGASALVVGTGAIGREIARLLRAAGMEVRGAGRTARSGDPDFGEVVASAELAQHVGSADHVVVVAPLTRATRGLVDTDVLAAMKSDAHLVNVGRGELVDEDALVKALAAGELGGASLDVFCTEPLPPDHPLWTTRGVVVSPHMSGDAVGWLDALGRQFLANAERWLEGRPLENVIDKDKGFAATPSATGPAPEETP